MDGNHPLKNIARLLISFNSFTVSGDKKHFIKELYNASLDYKGTFDVENQTIGLKRGSDQHNKILLNLGLLHLFVEGGCLVQLDGKLPNGKFSEFIANKNKTNVHIEAKNISRDKFSCVVYENPSFIGSRPLTENKQREIRKSFNTILRKDALDKFRNFEGLYIIAIGLPYNLGMLGEKIRNYIDNGTFFEKRNGFLALLIQDRYQEFLVFPNPHSSTNIFDWLGIQSPSVSQDKERLTILRTN